MASAQTIDDLSTLFSELRERSIKAGEKVENIRWEFLREVFSVPAKAHEAKSDFWNKVFWFAVLPTIALFVGFTLSSNDISSRCLFDVDSVLWNEITRKPSKCSFLCEGLNRIPRVSNLSQEEFLATYAYSGRPVVITDAAKNWSAVGKFSFKFFKRLYANHEEAAEENVDQGCMFFPYTSGFDSLAEALKMPKLRAEWKAGKPWYIGW